MPLFPLMGFSASFMRFAMLEKETDKSGRYTANRTALKEDIFKGAGVSDLVTQGEPDILCDEEDKAEAEE